MRVAHYDIYTIIDIKAPKLAGRELLRLVAKSIGSHQQEVRFLTVSGAFTKGLQNEKA